MVSIFHYWFCGFLRLQGTSLLQKVLELSARVQALKVRVSTNVLLLDVDVGDGTLARDLLESVLKSGAISCELSVADIGSEKSWAKLTNFVKLEELVIGVQFIQSLLGLLAVGAVRLGEDNCARLLAIAQYSAATR
jgi:hypothetical protein